MLVTKNIIEERSKMNCDGIEELVVVLLLLHEKQHDNDEDDGGGLSL